MLITDRIEKLEKKIVNYHLDQGERRLGYTVVADLKQQVDYICGPNDDWNVLYLKKLDNKCTELKL